MEQDADEELSEDRRKEIFRAVVDAQDQGVEVARSRRLIAQQFRVSDDQVRQIEREGMDAGWPPLD